MLSLPPSIRVFLCTQPTDMRRSFDGLAAITEEVLRKNPFSGHLFVFRNRREDRVKVLWWDRGGYAIYYKRLEEGTFRIPDSDGGPLEIDAADLSLILDGLELDDVPDRARFTPRRQKSLPVEHNPG